MIRLLFSPRSFRRHSARSSRDSGAATTHWLGGECHLSQSRHMKRTPSRSMPSVMSTVSLRQSPHNAPAACVPSMGAPQLQQRIVGAVDCRCWIEGSGIAAESSSMDMLGESSRGGREWRSGETKRRLRWDVNFGFRAHSDAVSLIFRALRRQVDSKSENYSAQTKRCYRYRVVPRPNAGIFGWDMLSQYSTNACLTLPPTPTTRLGRDGDFH